MVLHRMEIVFVTVASQQVADAIAKYFKLFDRATGTNEVNLESSERSDNDRRVVGQSACLRAPGRDATEAIETPR
jgi:hypothetical protein